MRDDLESDPDETRNLIAEQEALAGRLGETLESIIGSEALAPVAFTR